MSQLPEGFLDEVHDVLTHFYDYAYLVDHPLLHRMQPMLGCEGTLAVQKLRKFVLEAIESLRPRPDTPPNAPAWRPYTVLQHRFVLNEGLDETEAKLGLGRRQIQREQRRAILATAIVLWERQQAAMEVQPANTPGDPLWQEISRVAAEQQVFDAGEQFGRAMAPARALAQQQRVGLVEQRTSGPLLVRGDPALFRQLLLATLSHAIRSWGASSLTVRLERQGGDIICTLAATASPAATSELPEALLALAQAQAARVAQSTADGHWQLDIAVHAAERERTVVIVEDNHDVIGLYRRYLAGHGYQVIGVGDSQQALERIREIKPDVVVLDVMMREVDGWEILQRCKSDPELRDIPVAVCSVLDEPQLATTLGAQVYLRKPVRPAQLLECLAGLSSRPRSGEAAP